VNERLVNRDRPFARPLARQRSTTCRINITVQAIEAGWKLLSIINLVATITFALLFLPSIGSLAKKNLILKLNSQQAVKNAFCDFIANRSPSSLAA